MPPKKKGSKARSDAVVAKEAELAREVEQLRFEKERERVRNEEFMLRQRLEEEEHKLLESLRVREAEISNAIAERDRQADYHAREKELTVLLDQRERDTQELRAKVLGLRQAQTVLENERDSAVRRATMLTAEWETAQQKLAEVHEKHRAATAAQHDSHSALQTECDALRAEVAAVRGQREDAEREVQKLTEQLQSHMTKSPDEGGHFGEKGGSAEHLTQLNPRSSDAESAALFNVLHGEVEKYKEIAAHLQSSLDRKCRDEEKSSLLVGILNTQLESVREENKRLHTKAMKTQEEAEASRALVESTQKHHHELRDEMDRNSSEAAVRQSQLVLEIGVHQKQVEELTGRLDALNNSYTQLQKQFAEVSTKSTQREQEDLRTNTSMRWELEKQKLDLARILKEKQAVEDEAFNFKIMTRAEMDGLKTRLKKFQETMERKERESYETTQVLREEATRLETERQREKNSIALEVERLTKDLDATREQRDRVTAELEEKQSRFSITERDLYEKLVHMTACHDAKHQEVQQLRERLQEKEEAYTTNSIFLNAEKENLRSQVEELLAEAQKRRAEHLQHVERITADLAELQSRMTTDMAEQDAQYKRQKSRAELAERNVKRLQDQIRELEAKARTTELSTQDKVKALTNDARELRSELSIAKRTIERLEGAFGDQTGYNQLKELNERLSKEMEGYRAKVAHLSSVVVAMKVEQDVMGGYQLQKAKEEVEHLSRSVRQLERVQKLTTPLFRELRAIVERSGASTSLRASLEKYDLQMARIRSTGTDGAAAAAAPPAGDQAADHVHVDAAGDVVEAQDVTSTLPTILHPRPPSGTRSRVMETFFDKRSLHGNAANTQPTGGELPHLAA